MTPRRVLALLVALLRSRRRRRPAGTAESAGDWTQFRNGPRHRAVDDAETALSPASVGGLTPLWRDRIGGSTNTRPW